MKRTFVNVAIVAISLIGLAVCLTWSNDIMVSSVATQQDVVALHNRLNRIVDIRISGIERELNTLGTTTVLTIETMAPKVIPGVVHIMCPQRQGSGFVVGSRLIATARHIVKDTTDFAITTDGGHKLHATRAISFKEHDVGFIWVDDLHCVNEKCEYKYPCDFSVVRGKHEVELPVLELASIKGCRIGQTVFAVGSPYGKPNFNFLSSGIVSSLNPEWEEKGGEYGWEVGWTTTAVGHPGNSGCPIFSLDGKVRGVLVGGFSPVLILAMPVDLFIAHMDEITTMFEMDKFKKEQKAETASVQYTSKGEIE